MTNKIKFEKWKETTHPYFNLKLISKDIKKRLLFYKNEELKYLYNYLFSNCFYNKLFLNFKFFIFSKINKLISITKLRKFCIITGNSRSILKKWKISRIVFRDWAKTGFLHGVSKL
jgi:ribosomal protein S14